MDKIPSWLPGLVVLLIAVIGWRDTKSPAPWKWAVLVLLLFSFALNIYKERGQRRTQEESKHFQEESKHYQEESKRYQEELKRKVEEINEGQNKGFQGLNKKLGPRSLDAQALGKALQSSGPMTAAVWNDGSVEAGALAKQLVIGLQNAKWNAGGDNCKMGAPGFFPNALTVEVSRKVANEADHSIEKAESLVNALKQLGIDATIQETDQEFPPNFARIKVAGK